MDAQARFLEELRRLLALVEIDGQLTGEPAQGARARALSLGCRRPEEKGPFDEFFLEGPVTPLDDLRCRLPPEGVEVGAPETSALWRMQVEHVWSMPKPEGPGRSIKTNVLAKETGDVLGWLELASAPLSMGDRDDWCPVSSPNARVDLRTVGARPEFAAWRGGSLVGLLGLTDAVLGEWERRYGDRPELVQTTGAFGVSALYERKRVPSGRRWRRVQMTSGTYPVLSDTLMQAVRGLLGGVGTRHPVQDSRLKHGRENWRRTFFHEALRRTGHAPAQVRRISSSLGVRRALYGCRLEEPVGLEAQEEIDQVYEFWLERYAKMP